MSSPDIPKSLSTEEINDIKDQISTLDKQAKLKQSHIFLELMFVTFTTWFSVNAIELGKTLIELNPEQMLLPSALMALSAGLFLGGATINSLDYLSIKSNITTLKNRLPISELLSQYSSKPK